MDIPRSMLVLLLQIVMDVGVHLRVGKMVIRNRVKNLISKLILPFGMKMSSKNPNVTENIQTIIRYNVTNASKRIQVLTKNTVSGTTFYFSSQ